MEEKNQFKEFLASAMGRVVVTVIFAIIIYGLLVIALNSQSNVVLGITILVCAVFGWKALNKITPEIFLWMSIGGWAAYFFIKAILSVLIGVIIAPFQIGKMISNAVSSASEE